jgi:hypothetical protein
MRYDGLSHYRAQSNRTSLPALHYDPVCLLQTEDRVILHGESAREMTRMTFFRLPLRLVSSSALVVALGLIVSSTTIIPSNASYERE